MGCEDYKSNLRKLKYMQIAPIVEQNIDILMRDLVIWKPMSEVYSFKKTLYRILGKASTEAQIHNFKLFYNAAYKSTFLKTSHCKVK